MPIPDTSHYWKNAKFWSQFRYEEARSDITDAINKIYSQCTPSHSISSKKYSLKSLVKTYLDPSFNLMLTDHGLPSKAFTDLLTDKNQVPGDIYLVDVVRSFRKKTSLLEQALPGYSAKEKMISSSIDACRDFLKFCYQLGPHELLVAYVAQEDRTGRPIPPHIGRDRRKRRIQESTVKSKYPYPQSSLIDFGINWTPDIDPKRRYGSTCRACDLPTEAELERLRHIEVEDQDPKIKAFLEDGGDMVSGNRCSQKYCEMHSEYSNKSRYRKAKRDEIYFGVLIGAMCRAELKYFIDSNLLPWEAWRRFGALATENRNNKKELKKILDCSSKLIGGRLDDETAKCILAAVLAIYGNLGLTHEMVYSLNDQMPKLKI